MKPQQKKLAEQTVVLTGATSGIGLVAARMAGQRGARLVLVARNDGNLRRLTDEINGQGGKAICVVADVGDRRQVERVAETAISTFGGFDTWINNAGVTLFAPATEVTLEDAHRLFDTNFWGMVYGSRVAVEHLRERGGVLINVGSAVADRIIPFQAYYNASKAAVQAFTNTLRLELEKEGAPVAVTLIGPSAIDTPIAKVAKSYLDVQPRLPPPLYRPEVVAKVILHCTERPRREINVGASGVITGLMEMMFPSIVDRLMERFVFGWMKTASKPLDQDGLYTSASQLEERGGQSRYVAKTSMYTAARLYPFRAAAIVALASWLAMRLWRQSKA